MKNTKDNSCTANTLNWNPLADLIDTGDIAEAASPFLETHEYTSHTEYDALNRPISLTTPDGSVNLPTYNEAGLLDKVQACLRGASVDDTTPFVTNINYDAKGQRELVEYANGVYTEYTYDPLTFRVIRIRTIRTKDNACLQDLNYTYDPVGNITELRDNAQKTIFYDNARVEPVNSYEYDALYRLICAEGREHAGQNANAQPDHHNPPIINTPHPNDAQAMRNYTEDYGYDEVGNILCMDHNFANGGWKRNYQYEDVSNRLESTSLPGDDPEGPYGAKYGYDAHGNMTGMPHLQEMCWDFKDQMCQVNLDGGGTAYYIYDAGGQRARKVHEHNGSTVEERIYLGGYEIYRKHNGTGLTLERETLHIMDDQQRIALVETKTVENGSEVLNPKAHVRYQLSNHLVSSSLELDGEARVISYEEYYPFGSTSYQAVDKEIKAVAKRYRYTGKERDDETGLYYYGARYYAAWLGRWVSCDPMGLMDSENLFIYVINNPLNYYDGDGNEKNKPFSSGTMGNMAESKTGRKYRKYKKVIPSIDPADPDLQKPEEIRLEEGNSPADEYIEKLKEEIDRKEIENVESPEGDPEEVKAKRNRKKIKGKKRHKKVIGNERRSEETPKNYKKGLYKRGGKRIKATARMLIPELLKQIYFHAREVLKEANKQRENDILSNPNPPTLNELKFMNRGGWKYKGINPWTGSQKWKNDPSTRQRIADEINERIDIWQWQSENMEKLFELEKSGFNTLKIHSGVPIYYESEGLESQEDWEGKGCIIIMLEEKRSMSGIMTQGICHPVK